MHQSNSTPGTNVKVITADATVASGVAYQSSFTGSSCFLVGRGHVISTTPTVIDFLS